MKHLNLQALTEEAVETRNCRRIPQEEFLQSTCLYLATKCEHSAKQKRHGSFLVRKNDAKSKARLAKANALSPGRHRSPETCDSKESLIKFNGQTSLGARRHFNVVFRFWVDKNQSSLPHCSLL